MIVYHTYIVYDIQITLLMSMLYFQYYLTLSQRLDVPNVNFLPSTCAKMTLGMLSLVCQVGKDRREGVLYYYAGWREMVNGYLNMKLYNNGKR